MAAVSICFIPIIANLVFIQYSSLMGAGGITLADLRPDFQATYNSVMILGNGFICTAMLWATMMVALIDRKLARAAQIAWLGGGLTLFGIMHSPFPDGSLYLPFTGLPQSVYTVAVGYLLMGTFYLAMSAFNGKPKPDASIKP